MVNRYDNKPFNSLSALGLTPAQRKNSIADLLLGVGSPARSTLEEITRALTPPPQPTQNGLPTLASLFSPLPASGLQALGPPPPPLQPSSSPARALVKRKVFFSFHFDDVMRVSVVRNAWKISHPDAALMRSFYDSSLWEARKLEGDEALKRLIREGVRYTSAVCVLVGSETWLRRWVKYEVARAIIDGRGLLAVNINSLRHHQTKLCHPSGPNPLDFIAIGKVQDMGEARYFLFEKLIKPDGLGGYRGEWHRYEDYMAAITRPAWVPDPLPGYVVPLSVSANLYDYVVDHGHKNIGAWIDCAAVRAGR